jgi:hypothetical protein
MLNMKWTLSVVMLAASVVASAQSQRYRGTFELPFEARFGNVVLQPGSYTVSTLEGTRGIRITGDNGNTSILAAGYDLEPGNEKARMILVDAGGTYALQSFEARGMGVALQFLVVKTPRGAVERAAAKPAVEVGLQ